MCFNASFLFPGVNDRRFLKYMRPSVNTLPGGDERIVIDIVLIEGVFLYFGCRANSSGQDSAVCLPLITSHAWNRNFNTSIDCRYNSLEYYVNTPKPSYINSGDNDLTESPHQSVRTGDAES